MSSKDLRAMAFNLSQSQKSNLANDIISLFENVNCIKYDPEVRRHLKMRLMSMLVGYKDSFRGR